jgi:hypothetical protein
MGAEGDLVPPRLARGCRCFGAWAGEELIAYGWLAFEPEWIGEVGLEIRPQPGDGYIWNCVTLAPHRRRGNFAALVVFMTAQARSEGRSRMWIASVEGSAESAVAYAGFVPVLRIAAHTLPGLRRLHVGPVAGAGPALVAAACRALSVGLGWSLRRRRTRRH